MMPRKSPLEKILTTIAIVIVLCASVAIGVQLGTPPRALHWVGGIGWGGQRLFAFPALDLVVVMNLPQVRPGAEPHQLRAVFGDDAACWISLVSANVQLFGRGREEGF